MLNVSLLKEAASYSIFYTVFSVNVCPIVIQSTVTTLPVLLCDVSINVNIFSFAYSCLLTPALQ